MLDRFDRDVGSANLSRLVICCGVNDIFGSGLTLAQMQAATLLVLAKATALAIPVDLIPPPPQTSSRAGWTTGKRDVYKAYRNWLMQYANATTGFGFIDSWAASAGSSSFIDPADANLNPIANATFDNIHPSSIGAMLLTVRRSHRG